MGVIRRGRLAALGPPESLRPGDSSLVRVTGVGLGPQVAQAVAVADGVLGTAMVDGALEARLRDGASAAPLVRALVEMGIDVDEVKRERPTLEDTFLELVSEDSGGQK